MKPNSDIPSFFYLLHPFYFGCALRVSPSPEPLLAKARPLLNL